VFPATQKRYVAGVLTSTTTNFPSSQASGVSAEARYKWGAYPSMSYCKKRKFDPGDSLRPDSRQSAKIFSRSRQSCYPLLAAARSKKHLPLSCTHINHFLCQTPSIPEGQIEEIVQKGSLSLHGFSQWRISSQRICNLSAVGMPPEPGKPYQISLRCTRTPGLAHIG
jgi:hypothetical protein